mgnify:CR=1 FL=1
MTITLPAGVQVIERGWLSANLVVAHGQVPALIDSGYVAHQAQTVQLARTALKTQEPALLINTHLHSDHCGGNAALQSAFPQMRTWIPPGQAQEVAAWNEDALTYRPTGQDCPRFRFEGLLQPGQDILLGDLPWQVHAAPGHDPHSVVLFEPVSRTLISADALWQNGFGVVFPELEGESAFGEVAATLDRIEDLQPAVVIPGHGSVFAYSPQVMDRARQRLASFVNSPKRHAQHAAKVLIKFKLLEVQKQPTDVFVDWAASTPYLALLHQRFYAEQGLRDWLQGLLGELQAVGAARLDSGWTLNA